MQTRVLVPSGVLGLGFDPDALARGVAANPDIIAIDGGSTDSGPFYLGTGTSKYSRSVCRDEWRQLLEARATAGVPLVIGSCGTCGTAETVDWMFRITCELAAELGQTLRVARLYSDVPVETLRVARDSGRLSPLHPAQTIDDAALEAMTNIVALAGAEQIQAAIHTGADVVLAGRATDTATIAALPLARGAHSGAAWHGAKIAECGAFCTTRPASGVVMVTFDEAGFTVTPMGEGVRCTPQSVAAHMLYENADPYILHEPGGWLDVREARYTALDEVSVRVEGSIWHNTKPYTVKLEAARRAGFQTVSFVLVRDAHYREHIDDWVTALSASFQKKAVRSGLSDTKLELRVIGRNATLGALEKLDISAGEVGVMAIFTSPTQQQANEAAKLLNPDLLHLPLTPHEPMPTFAFPFSPPEMDRGASYEFCLHHIMAIDDPLSAFRLEITES